jgi:hypothetical protein
MQNITSTAGLKNAIQILEARHTANGQQLKVQFHLTYEGFKPVNLLRSTLKDVASSPTLIDNILGTTIGLATGYLSKKLIVGSSGNIIRKLIGSVLQLGVTNLVAQNPEAIKSVGQFILQHIFRKKEMNSENRD